MEENVRSSCCFLWQLEFSKSLTLRVLSLLQLLKKDHCLQVGKIPYTSLVLLNLLLLWSLLFGGLIVCVA